MMMSGCWLLHCCSLVAYLAPAALLCQSCADVPWYDSTSTCCKLPVHRTESLHVTGTAAADVVGTRPPWSCGPSRRAAPCGALHDTSAAVMLRAGSRRCRPGRPSPACTAMQSPPAHVRQIPVADATYRAHLDDNTLHHVASLPSFSQTASKAHRQLS